MPDPSTLVAALTATLDRVEDMARRATRGPWEREGNGPVIGALGVYVTAPYTDEDHDVDLDLIAALGPDRVLALVAKARKVIETHQAAPSCGCKRSVPGWWCVNLRDEAEAWGVTP